VARVVKARASVRMAVVTVAMVAREGTAGVIIPALPSGAARAGATTSGEAASVFAGP
jgi:hypothetical protein